MIADVVVEPMTEEFIVWRCLHGGPLARSMIDQCSPGGTVPFACYRDRNTALLTKLTQTYGACAIVARDGDRVVGHLRFYPKAVCDLKGAGGLCLQQAHPEGPVNDFADGDFPTLAQIADKTLVVHCLMMGSSQQQENPYQRKGIGSRLVKTLIGWAKENGWERIEAHAFEDLPIVYEMTGSTGHSFWAKLGFRVVDRHPHPDLQDREQFAEFITTLEAQAKSLGIPPERARDQIVMRLDLT